MDSSATIKISSVSGSKNPELAEEARHQRPTPSLTHVQRLTHGLTQTWVAGRILTDGQRLGKSNSIVQQGAKRTGKSGGDCRSDHPGSHGNTERALNPDTEEKRVVPEYKKSHPKNNNRHRQPRPIGTNGGAGRQQQLRGGGRAAIDKNPSNLGTNTVKATTTTPEDPPPKESKR